jgi:hypothetical protein
MLVLRNKIRGPCHAGRAGKPKGGGENQLKKKPHLDDEAKNTHYLTLLHLAVKSYC